jgi:galactokinase
MAETASADAPGRVNLIGEHTDYHDGYVLPTVIPQRTRAYVRRRGDMRVHAVSSTIAGGAGEFELGRETPGRGWLDYVQGVMVSLSRSGVPLAGFDLRVESTVPVGAGVSSSAALEVSLLRALRTLLDLDLDDATLAKIARAAETDFVGAPVGIMDQMAASVGRDGDALFLDTRTLAVERIPIPPSIEIVAVDSGITHAHAGGEYAARRRESFEAASLLGVERLRDVDVGSLPRIAALPPIPGRRARHIVTENARVLAAVDALRAADVERLGALFVESHASMRDDYETSTPAVDALVEIAQRHPAVYGARLTGGGFGGAIVAIAQQGRGRRAAVEVCDAYRRATGNDGRVLVPQATSSDAAD